VDNKPIENERTLGPVVARGAAEAVAALPYMPYSALPGYAQGSRRFRLQRRALGLVVSWSRGLDWSPAAGLTPERVAFAGIALLASASLVTWSDGLDWTPERMLLVFLAPALVMRRTTRFLSDSVPFALLIVAYAECRGLAHLIAPHPFYRPQLDLERALFRVVPAQWLQEQFWLGQAHWYDGLSTQLMRLHFVVPPMLAFGLWVKRRALFARFAASIVALSFAAAAIFAVFPAAPPWAAAKAGLLPHVVKLPQSSAPHVSSAGLSSHTFSVASVIPGNPYAAIPSLHAGYAFLVFLTVASILLRRGGRYRWPLVGVAFSYPLLQSLAVVYTGNHYVIDIAIGFAFAFAAFIATNRVWRRLGLPG
jgi:membrane-associated phospholipid phosphatase